MLRELTNNSIPDLVEDLQRGSVRALARLITLVENVAPMAREALQKLYAKTGHAYILGITGPPGSGKSTLTDGITAELRRQGYTVGIVAVDPSSAFSRGALLGDRLRMKSITGFDPGVFFRSMATRGTMGGLSSATTGTVELMDAFGMDYIIVETVGVGQDELDIVKTADTTLLVSVPGLGDEIQALKAGLMEIGDIYVVNKADRDGADQLVADLSLMRDLANGKDEWSRPIVQTDAVKGIGIKDLINEFMVHREHLETSGEFVQRRQERVKTKIKKLVEYEIATYVENTLSNLGDEFEAAVQSITRRKLDPYTFVDQLTTIREGLYAFDKKKSKLDQ